jgi:hypothetical protein
MSNGKNWRSYLAIFDNPFYVEDYLSNSRYGHGASNTSGRVYFEGLKEDTNTSRPPSREWYKLHLIAVTHEKFHTAEDLWPTLYTAWGLNIWESDLIQMQQSLMQKFAYIRCEISQNGGPGRTGEERPAIDLSAYSLVEAAYKCMRSRFPLSPDSLEINCEWHMAAIYRIVMSCWNNSFLALDCGYYSKTDGRSTKSGDETWQDLLACAADSDRKHGLDAAIMSRKHGLDAAIMSRKRAMGDDEGERSPKRLKLNAATVSQKRVMEDDKGERSPKRPKTRQDAA